MNLPIGPTRIGAFLVEALLGRGGASTVWRARHEPTGTPVALKLTPAANTDPAGVELETATLARLHHPSIVHVHDQGTLDAPMLHHPEGTRWLAMELATSSSLGRITALGWDDVVGLVQQVLGALAHAHARGVLHRDVKPGNVLYFDDAVVPWKLADFGIAHHLGQPTAHLGGSPSYVAPEQSGHREDQGPWTDLYALGHTAWHLVTGQRRPWKRDDDHSFRHLSVPFEPRFEVPEGVEDWLLWLTARQPEARPQRASEAWEAFARVLAPGQPERGPRPLPVSLALPGTARRGALLGLSLFALRSVPFVGRVEARQALWEQLRKVEAEGRRRSLALTGPPGIGKRRLAQWLASAAHEAGAHAVVLGAQAPAPFVDQLLGSSASSVVERFAERHQLHPVDRAALLAMGWGASLEAGTMAAMLDAASSERPVVLAVLDDLDARGVALLAAILEGSEERPILVVATGPPPPNTEVREVAVSPLGAVEMEELLDATLPLESTLRSFLRNHAQGVPGRPLAWLRSWAVADQLRLGPDGIERVGGPPADPPPLAEALQRARAEALWADLDAVDQPFLGLLAVLGPHIERTWLGPLGRAHGPALHELVLRGHVSPTRTHLRFVDPSFHDVLVRTVAAPADAHRQAAELLEAAEGPSHRLGMHLHHAGSHDRAFRALYEGSDALRLAGNPRIELAELARGSLEACAMPDDPRWIELDRHLGLVLQQLGRASQALAPLTAAVRAARRLRAPEELALSLVCLATARAMTGDTADLDPVYAEAAEVSADDPGTLARVWASWSDYLDFHGKHERIRAMLPRHIPHLVDDTPRLNAYVSLARAATHSDDLEQAMQAATAARAAARRIGTRNAVVRANFVLGEVHLVQHHNIEGHTCFEEALALARHGSSHDLATAYVNHAFSSARLGAWQDALGSATAGQRMARRLGWRAMELMGHGMALWPLAALGRWAALDEALREALPLTESRASTWELGEVLLRTHALLPTDRPMALHHLVLLCAATAQRLPHARVRGALVDVVAGRAPESVGP